MASLNACDTGGDILTADRMQRAGRAGEASSAIRIFIIRHSDSYQSSRRNALHYCVLWRCAIKFPPLPPCARPVNSRPLNPGNVIDDNARRRGRDVVHRCRPGGDQMSDLIIDANVIRNIAQGNRAAAEALKKLLASSRRIYIAQAAYNEVVVVSDQYRQLLQDLGLNVSPASSVPAKPKEPGVITARGNVYADNMHQVPKPS